MPDIVGTLREVGRKINNYDVDATGGGLWTDTTHYRATVPTGRRWYFLGGTIYRDVNATVVGYVYDSSDNPEIFLVSKGAATGLSGYPDSNAPSGIYAHPMDPGDYVELTFGGAQDALAYATCTVLEVLI